MAYLDSGERLQRNSGIYRVEPQISAYELQQLSLRVSGCIPEMASAIALLAPEARVQSVALCSELPATRSQLRRLSNWLARPLQFTGTAVVPNGLRHLLGAPQALQISIRSPVQNLGILAVGLPDPAQLDGQLARLASLCSGWALELEAAQRTRAQRSVSLAPPRKSKPCGAPFRRSA